jgi:hypothetical protein
MNSITKNKAIVAMQNYNAMDSWHIDQILSYVQTQVDGIINTSDGPFYTIQLKPSFVIYANGYLNKNDFLSLQLDHLCTNEYTTLRFWTKV